MPQNKIVVFESKKIRRIWHDEEWYFSVVDVCGALTDSPDAGAYWRKLKQRLNNEGSQVVTFCHGLKLEQKTEKPLVNSDNYIEITGKVEELDNKKSLKDKRKKEVIRLKND